MAQSSPTQLQRRLFNCQPSLKEPDWSAYHGIVMCAVCEDKYGVCQPCQTLQDAEFFTVYAVHASGEVEAVTDTDNGASLAEAVDLAREIASLSRLPLQMCRALPEASA